MAALTGKWATSRLEMPSSYRRYCLVALGLFGLFWLGLAIAPHDRADWALENVLVVLFVPALLASLRYFPCRACPGR